MYQKETFNIFCKERFFKKCVNSKTVSSEKGEKVIKYLKESFQKKNVILCSNTGYPEKDSSWLTMLHLVWRDVLCVPTKETVGM